MTELTGGELLARALANEGVTFVFGLPCPEIDPLLAALDANGIRLVTIRHEAAAVHMAEGLYKTTGQVAVVLGNPGPGSANLVPGMLTAKHEGVPVLASRGSPRSFEAARLRVTAAPTSLCCEPDFRPGPRPWVKWLPRGPAPASIRHRRSVPSAQCSAATRCTAPTAE
jgi:hypothetical protein